MIMQINNHHPFSYSICSDIFVRHGSGKYDTVWPLNRVWVSIIIQLNKSYGSAGIIMVAVYVYCVSDKTIKLANENR